MQYRKYKNKKIVLDGHKFDSLKEARRYKELKLLQKTGEIEELELQPKFELLEKFNDKQGKHHRAVTYIADFRYKKRDEIVVEDTKGFRTEVYKIKYKFFKSLYPNIDFREI